MAAFKKSSASRSWHFPLSHYRSRYRTDDDVHDQGDAAYSSRGRGRAVYTTEQASAFALCVCATGMRSRRRADGSPWIIIINTLAAGFHSNSPRIGEVPPRASSSPFLFPFPLGVGTCVPSTLGALGRARLPLTKYRHRTERPWDHNDHDR